MMVKESFEATYPHFAFAPLVRLGVAVAAFITGRRTAAPTEKKGSAVGGALGSAA